MGHFLFPQTAQKHQQEDGSIPIGAQGTQESVNLFLAEDLGKGIRGTQEGWAFAQQGPLAELARRFGVSTAHS